jgi:hypothetical protein
MTLGLTQTRIADPDVIAAVVGHQKTLGSVTQCLAAGGVRCSRVPSLLLRLRLADDSIWDIVDTETDQLLDQLRVLYSRMLGR